jgi:hypothetical protein
MTQFEVMINLAGIKTKEGEDFVKVIKEIRVPGNSRWLGNECAIFLENGSVCAVSMHSVRYNAGMSLGMFGDKIYNFNQIGIDAFWSEFRRAMTEIAGLYEF